jgi:hypothetical protein
MKKFIKILLIFLFVLNLFSAIFGQKEMSKVFSPDNSIISKSVFQKRDITQYFDGGNFRCGLSSSESECDYKKIREAIWQCWTEKTLCYLTISAVGVDSSYDQHIFIEPNKNNQWQVVRRVENGHTMRQFRKPIHDLPRVYFLEWRKNKDEKVLIFKNKLGKVIEEF